ncbi:transposase [Inquilinus limosus]
MLPTRDFVPGRGGAACSIRPRWSLSATTIAKPARTQGQLWRDLPERYGPCTTVCNRFNSWVKAGCG